MDRVTSKLNYPISSSDITGFYQLQTKIWHLNGIQYAEHFGYPDHVPISQIANYEIVQTTVTGISSLFTKNIFLAGNVNVVISIYILFYFGFLLSKKFIRNTNNVFHFAAAISIGSLPWITSRLEHVGLLYLEFCLAPLFLLNISSKSRKKLILNSISIGTLGAIFGGYVFGFTIMVAIFCTIVDTVMHKNKQIIIKWLVYWISLVTSFISILIIFGFFSEGTREINRDITDSIHYGGYLFLLFIPTIHALPQVFGFSFFDDINKQLIRNTESVWMSNQGTLVLVLMILILFFNFIKKLEIKNSQKIMKLSDENELETSSNEKIFAGLSIFLLLLFIKGGLGPFISQLILNPIRAWNRLVFPLSIVIMILGFSIIARLKTKILNAFLILILMLNIFQMYSNGINLSFPRISDYNLASSMIKNLQSSLNPGCAILQFPELANDGSGAPREMRTYDHYLPAILDDKFNWTYGKLKFKKELTKPLDSVEIFNLKRNGYCAIEIDKFGVTETEINRIFDSNKLFVIYENYRYKVLKFKKP